MFISQIHSLSTHSLRVIAYSRQCGFNTTGSIFKLHQKLVQMQNNPECWAHACKSEKPSSILTSSKLTPPIKQSQRNDESVNSFLKNSHLKHHKRTTTTNTLEWEQIKKKLNIHTHTNQTTRKNAVNVPKLSHFFETLKLNCLEFFLETRGFEYEVLKNDL